MMVEDLVRQDLPAVEIADVMIVNRGKSTAITSKFDDAAVEAAEGPEH